jgi:hypothetical protein
VAVFLPPRKVEAPIEEKSTSLFGAKGFKPMVAAPPPPPVATSSLSTGRTGIDDANDIYKTHPAFVAIIEPIANKFMTIKELIEVKLIKNTISTFVFFFAIEITINRSECFS